ncbi:hypothetical protein GVAV_000994 [Gurleya vavrai]
MQQNQYPNNNDLIYENEHNSGHSKIQKMNRIFHYIDNFDFNKYEDKKSDKPITMNPHHKKNEISDGIEKINGKNEKKGSDIKVNENDKNLENINKKIELKHSKIKIVKKIVMI